MALVPDNRLRHRVDLPTETKPGEDGRIAGGDGPDLVLGTDTENRKAYGPAGFQDRPHHDDSPRFNVFPEIAPWSIITYRSCAFMSAVQEGRGGISFARK